jgi:uncharacterized protein (TIGR02246 family)
MSTATPPELAPAFAAAVNARDLPAALALWDERARLVTADGTAIDGRAAIAGVLAALIEHGSHMQIELTALHEAGDVAVASGTVTVTAADGFAARSDALAVYARGADGRWRLAIDAPWGLATDGALSAAALDGQQDGRLGV